MDNHTLFPLLHVRCGPPGEKGRRRQRDAPPPSSSTGDGNAATALVRQGIGLRQPESPMVFRVKWWIMSRSMHRLVGWDLLTGKQPRLGLIKGRRKGKAHGSDCKSENP